MKTSTDNIGYIYAVREVADIGRKLQNLNTPEYTKHMSYDETEVETIRLMDKAEYYISSNARLSNLRNIEDMTIGECCDFARKVLLSWGG